MLEYIDTLESKLKNADYYRINIIEKEIQSSEIKEGVIDQIIDSQNKGLSIFYTFGKSSYFYSTNNLENVKNFNVNKDIKKIKNLDYVPKESGITDSKKIGTKSKNNFEDVVKELKDVSKLSPNIKSHNISYNTINEKRYTICENTNIKQEFNYGILYNHITAKSGNKVKSITDRICKSTNLDNFYKTILENNEEKEKLVIKSLKYKEGIKGEFKTILYGDITDLLCHEAIGHSLESDLTYYKESILWNKLKEKIGPENITLYDDPSPNTNYFGVFYYDDEGFPAKKKALIKNGYVNDFILTDKHSQLYDLKNNGGARCESYLHKPIPRMSNTYLKQGDLTYEELIQEMKNGVILRQGSGGQTNPMTGTYQFGIGFIDVVKNSEIVETRNNVSFSGNIFDALNQIELISKSYGEYFPGFCGKNGQKVFVGGGSPHVLLKKVRFK